MATRPPRPDRSAHDTRPTRKTPTVPRGQGRRTAAMDPDGAKRLVWPRTRSADPEEVKWRVWVGHQLREWRLRPRVVNGRRQGPSLGQKGLAARAGITQPRLSKIETGAKALEPRELRGLAKALALAPADLFALFVPPSDVQWQEVLGRYEDDPRFTAPPRDPSPRV